MTIGCTRCGATCEGDIISAPLAFTFKHEVGCGHGVGPLAVFPSSKKAPKKAESEYKKTEEKSDVIVEVDEAEEKPKKSIVEKVKKAVKKEDDN
jgi:hypothetical protein